MLAMDVNDYVGQQTARVVHAPIASMLAPTKRHALMSWLQ